MKGKKGACLAHRRGRRLPAREVVARDSLAIGHARGHVEDQVRSRAGTEAMGVNDATARSKDLRIAWPLCVVCNRCKSVSVLSVTLCSLRLACAC